MRGNADKTKTIFATVTLEICFGALLLLNFLFGFIIKKM